MTNHDSVAHMIFLIWLILQIADLIGYFTMRKRGMPAPVFNWPLRWLFWYIRRKKVHNTHIP